MLLLGRHILDLDWTRLPNRRHITPASDTLTGGAGRVLGHQLNVFVGNDLTDPTVGVDSYLIVLGAEVNLSLAVCRCRLVVEVFDQFDIGIVDVLTIAR